jgi:hypothetical protein
MPRTWMRRAGGVLALAALLGLAACEPSGPGTLTVDVGPVGAVVVELTGTGVVGFGGLGDARTFEAPAVAGALSRRVVVVSPTGANVRFKISVEDVGALFPTATIVSAVDAANEPIDALAGLSLRVSRSK